MPIRLFASFFAPAFFRVLRNLLCEFVDAVLYVAIAVSLPSHAGSVSFYCA
jgi:hypothetical protein